MDGASVARTIRHKPGNSIPPPLLAVVKPIRNTDRLQKAKSRKKWTAQQGHFEK
jgi:hypothetical protein